MRSAPIKPARARRSMLDGHQYGAAPLSADRDPLGEPEDQQRDRSPNANLVIGRQEADQSRCRAHNEERRHEHGFSTDPVAEMSEEGAAKRSREITDRKRRKRNH